MSIRYSPSALRDLEQIAVWIARDNPVRARSFVAELKATCRKLAEIPRAAPAKPEFGDGVRIHPHRSYLIVLKPTRAGALIIRVLHASRELHATLSEPRDDSDPEADAGH